MVLVLDRLAAVVGQVLVAERLTVRGWSSAPLRRRAGTVPRSPSRNAPQGPEPGSVRSFRVGRCRRRRPPCRSARPPGGPLGRGPGGLRSRAARRQVRRSAVRARPGAVVARRHPSSGAVPPAGVRRLSARQGSGASCADGGLPVPGLPGQPGHPQAPHYYLPILGVDPGLAGTGHRFGPCCSRSSLGATASTWAPTWKPPARAAGRCTRGTASHDGRAARRQRFATARPDVAPGPRRVVTSAEARRRPRGTGRPNRREECVRTRQAACSRAR